MQGVCPGGGETSDTGVVGSADAALAAHPDVDKTAVPGEAEAGKKSIAAQIGKLKRVTL